MNRDRCGWESPSGLAESSRTGRRFLDSNDASIMLYRQPAVQSFQYHHGRPGIAAAFQTRQQLQSAPLELDGVVPCHSSAVLEAQDLLQVQVRLQGPESRLGTLGWDLEAPVESRQELREHGPGLSHGGRSRQPEFRDQPVMEGPGRPLHPALGLGRQGENQPYPQLLHCPAELGGRAGGLIFRPVFEYRVPVRIEGEGKAAPARSKPCMSRK